MEEKVLNCDSIDNRDPTEKNGVLKFVSNLLDLKRFDCFGVSFDFRLENHKKYVSKTGGLWFIIYLAICFYYFVNQSHDFFYHPELSTFSTFSNLHSNKFIENIRITKENFLFAFIPPKMPKLSDIHQRMLFGKLVNLTDFFDIECTYNLLLRENALGEESDDIAKMIEKINFDNNTLYRNDSRGQVNRMLTKKLKRAKCNVTDFFYSSNQTKKEMQNITFENYGLIGEDLYCFEKNDDYVIAGDNFHKYYSFFKIKVKAKKKNEFLREKLYSFQWKNKFKLIYSNINIDYGDFGYFEKTAIELKDYVDHQYRKNIDIHLQRNSFHSDEDFFSKSEKKFDYTKVLRTSTRLFPIDTIIYTDTDNEIYSDSDSFLEVYFKPNLDNPILKLKGKKFWILINDLSTFAFKVLAIMRFIVLSLNTSKAKSSILNEFLIAENQARKDKDKHFYELKEKIKENISLNKVSPNVTNKINTAPQNDLDTQNYLIPPNKKDQKRKNQSHIAHFERAGKLKSNDCNISINNNLDDNIFHFGKKEKKILNSNFIASPNKSKNNNFKENKDIIDIINEFELSSFDETNEKKNEHLIKKENVDNNTEIDDSCNIEDNNISANKKSIDEFKIDSSLEKSQTEAEIKDRMVKGRLIDRSIKRKNFLKSLTHRFLKFSFTRFIENFFSCEWTKISKAKNYRSLSEMKFDNFININNSMRKSTEVDVLKYLLLDEDMLYMNSYISRSLVPHKEPIDLENIPNNFNIYFQRDQNNSSDTARKDYEMMKITYFNLKNKIHKSEADNKIIDLFEHQFETMTSK